MHSQYPNAALYTYAELQTHVAREVAIAVNLRIDLFLIALRDSLDEPLYEGDEYMFDAEQIAELKIALKKMTPAVAFNEKNKP